jgi:tRNA (guanine-N7-)-methyltransferase
VMVYCADDPIQAKRLEEMGCVAIMPLGAPIGSGMGVVNPYMIRLIIEQAKVPVLVDAGSARLGRGHRDGTRLRRGADEHRHRPCAGPVRMARAMKGGRGRPRGLPGRPHATAKIADANREIDYLGVEVHVPGVGALCKQIAERNLENLRICQHDAVEVVRDMLPEAALDGVHVFFPDPWHKARHNKRRLIQSPFVALLASRLKPGGYFHCATDWEDYAHQMLEVLSAEPTLENTASHQLGGFAPRPEYRPLTKFENRGLRLGHGVWDVIFRKK